VPAPAVIPALIVYIKVVAVKKLVVDHLVLVVMALPRRSSAICSRTSSILTGR